MVVFYHPLMPRVAMERFTWPVGSNRVSVAFPQDFEVAYTQMYTYRVMKDDSNCSNSVYVPLSVNE